MPPGRASYPASSLGQSYRLECRLLGCTGASASDDLLLHFSRSEKRNDSRRSKLERSETNSFANAMSSAAAGQAG